MIRPYCSKIVFALAALFCAECYGIDSVKFDKRSSLFVVTDKTVPVVTASYLGWAESWKWAGPKIKSNKTDESDTAQGIFYNGTVPKLDIDFSTTVSQTKNQLVWTYKWDKKNNHPDAIGFGMGFKFNLDSPGFKEKAKEPELLPENQGWRWQTPDGDTVEVKFSPALAKISYGNDKKSKIRALFFTSIEKGNTQTTMTVAITGQSPKMAGFSVNNAEEKAENWHKDILPDKESPLDLSFLNANDKPAGKHGFVKAQSDQLVFEDGTPVKFWGTNVMAYALFSSPDDEIKTHAKRIAKLGFNLVRIHHHDSGWVKPNIFENPDDNTQELSNDSFKKLDLWIKSLKDEGVYVWLDLHVGRAFTEKDHIDNFADLTEGKSQRKNLKKNKDTVNVKGFNYYNESIQKQMQNFNQAYLSHVNSFTNLAYKDDPAVVTLLITNENDLTHHFGSALLKNKGTPIHNGIFADDVKKFAETNGLPEKSVKRVWEMGMPKIYLSDVEHRFNQKMIAHLRGLGVKSMIATTNSWGYMELFGLPSLTDGDLIDAHSYGKAEELNYNPRFNPGFLTWIGAAQVTGKPLSVTEWNLGTFPVEDRYTAPLYTASLASFQCWDAMMLYGYSQAPLLGKANARSGNWTAYNDPAIMGLMPAAALLYRQGHVAPAKINYELKLSADDFFYKKQDPTTSKAIRTLLETSRFTVTVPETKELPWVKGSKSASKTMTVSDANKDFIPEGQNFVQSDTGELRRDWEKGIHTINTAKSQIASGGIGGQTISLKDVTFKINTPKAVVAIQSLENKPIKESKTIFITALARSIPSDKQKLPFSSEPVTGEITVLAPAGLSLYPINGLSEKGSPIKLKYSNGGYQIKLDDKFETGWFLLSPN